MSNLLKIKTLIGISLTLGMFVSGCHTQESEESSSETNDIATDLPDTGSDLPIHLYWVTDTRIYRGFCANRDVMLRTQCRDNVAFMSWGEFKQDLDGGLSTTIRALQQEARNIQMAMASVEAQIQQILAEINRIEQQQGSLSVELRNLRTQMQEFQVIVQEYRQQLNLIEQSLAQAVDRDMSELRLYVMGQIQKYQQNLTNVSNRITVLMGQIRDANVQLVTLRDQANRLNNRLQNLNGDLSIVQTRLTTAYSDFSVYEGTLRRLTSGIVHPILADNTWFSAERQFVKRFDRIFNSRQ